MLNIKNPALSLPVTKVSAFKVQLFLLKIVSKEGQYLTLLPPFWTVLSSQAVFSWRHSVQDIFSKWLLTTLTTTLSYRCFEAYFEPNMLKTMKMNAVKRVKWIAVWKKMLFTDLVKDAKSVASFLLLAKFESESRHINTAWLPTTVTLSGNALIKRCVIPRVASCTVTTKLSLRLPVIYC